MDDEPVPVFSRDPLSKLLQRPFCRRVGGDIAVDDPTCPDFDDHEDVKDAKRRRHHNEEIASHDRRRMVSQKRQPSLRRIGRATG